MAPGVTSYALDMEILGLPLHPLIVHAVVIFAPLAGLFVLAYALVPRWRWLLRWPTVLLAAVALVTGYIAKLSGEDLLEKNPTLAQIPAVHTHEDRADLLVYLLVAMLVVMVVAAWRLGGGSPLASRGGERTVHGGAVDLLVMALTAAAGIAVVVMAILTGHAGAEAVWGS